ncbi:transcriptional regulator [bacterium CPR1]|nr:transcriptional regulator [bacterium CPR1]
MRSPCPLANALDLLGDRWTLLVLRDLFMGKRRFGDFLESPEKIATNILSERLRRLEEAGLVEKRRYQERPAREEYRLTSRGAETLPIIQAAVRWATKHIPDTWRPPESLASMTPEQWLESQS